MAEAMKGATRVSRRRAEDIAAECLSI
jgi:hypothetical protein